MIIINETINIINSHRTIRKFKNKEIEKDKLLEIIKAAQKAPSSKNMQAYSIINVTDKKKKAIISELSNNQEHIKESAVFLVFCADLNRLKTACSIHGKSLEEGYVESLITATVDTALAAQNAMIVAESLGLGGVYVGGIKNNPKDICNLLKIPKNVYPVFGMSLGYPDQNPETKPRLPMEVVFKENEYCDKNDEKHICDYDRTMKNYYLNRTDQKKEENWSEIVSNNMSGELRPHMKKFLIEQGFNTR